MPLLIRLLALLPLSAAAQAATITAHDTTIELRGEIAAGDAERFAAQLQPSTRTLVLRSQGGDLSIALAIGKSIFERHLRLEVDGLCASACAQLLLPAALEVHATDGTIIAMHGAEEGAVRSARSEGHFPSDATGIASEALENSKIQFDAMDSFRVSAGVRRDAMEFMYQLTSTSDVSVQLPDKQALDTKILFAGRVAPICRTWLLSPESLRAMGIRAADWRPAGRLKASFVLGEKYSEIYDGPVVDFSPEDRDRGCARFRARVEKKRAQVSAQ